MGKREVIIRAGIMLLFLISLYFVEAGFCGSRVVAKYNGGFGTLDMKKYDIESVKRALLPMSQKGLNIYKLYYLMDYIFVLFFGAFQIMLLRDVYSLCESQLLKVVILAVPVLRGFCDIVENTILLRTLFTFPKVNELAISISNCFTQVKLECIKAWGLLVFIGLIWRIVLHIKG